MRSKVFILLPFLVASLFYQCGKDGSSGGLSISGKINNAGSMQVYLDKVGISPTSANLVVGKADADASGNFKLSFPQKLSEGIYRLRVGEQKMNLILDGKESDITVNGDLAKLNQFDYEVTGSASSTTYRNILQKLVSRQLRAEDIRTFVDTTSNPLTGVYVAVQSLGNNTSMMDIHEKAKARMVAAYPGTTYKDDYEAHLASIKQAAVNPGGGNGFNFVEEGNRQPAPDIKLPSPNGKEFALSDLKGKVVLLDFWASWCRPCRMENPNVVRIYNQYKDKGFTVFSVSLDGVDSRQMAAMQNDPKMVREATNDAKKKWKEAIAQDGLVWDYHVSDLKKWECEPARQYGVSSIPRTFMIDKEGKIAAVNLRGAEQIEETLKKLL
ncbi:MAG: TlpA family protein disulfide reductase [Lewinellaceae bacterium]|nr:TlpA family protein disulfide reductase [Saprospiraceae bacterium]MCB9340175.1 TlpA family protein disulfide reductase [Lewinellaceae bacterium]